MTDSSPNTVLYKRSRFTTRLPSAYQYTQAHSWLLEEERGLIRVGLTKFATRMLGDLVEFEFTVRPGDPVEVADTIGWIEGFKATSDLYCAAKGKFLEANPVLAEDVTRLESDPYGGGWLYRVAGVAEPNAMDVEAYMGVLDATIDKMLASSRKDADIG